MDKSGRFLLSAPLRQHAKLTKEIMLVGQLNKFEIWSSESWDEQIQSDISTEQDADFELTDRLQDFSL
jgi:MraZ protein